MAEIEYTVDRHIARLTVNRPAKMNAMTDAMYAAIGDAVQSAEADPNVRAVIVTGAGDTAFSAGHDLAELADRDDAQGWQPWRGKRFDQGLPCSKPLIAAVNGYCLAGGLELALFCDIRIATPTAQFGAPEVTRGILHGFGALRLPDLIGMSHSLELLTTGEFMDAETALRVGLVNRVVPHADLMSTAEEMAHRIASNAPIAVRLIKELAYRGRELPLADGLRLYQEYARVANASDDAREGTRAFVEKRDAQFTGS